MSKIIGQDKLIKEVNKIFQVFVNSNCKIRPHFILTGESGLVRALLLNSYVI